MLARFQELTYSLIAQMLAADGARGLGPIYGGRIVAGLGIGAASNLTPLYISEIAPPAIRGQLIGMYEIGWQSALLSTTSLRRISC